MQQHVNLPNASKKSIRTRTFRRGWKAEELQRVSEPAG